MDELKQMEKDVATDLDLLEGFAHPSISEDRIGTIVGAMAQTHRRGRARTWVYRLGFPAAVAAGLILSISLFLTEAPAPVDPVAPPSEFAVLWADELEEAFYSLYADLDFTGVGHQTQASEETLSDLDEYILELMGIS